MKIAALSFLVLFAGISCYAQPGAGNTLDFTGTSYTYTANSNTLNPAGAMSVEAWIYPTSFGPNSWINTIVSTDAWTGGNGEEGYVLRCGDNGKLSFNIATPTTSWKEAVSPALMATNQWHHVVGTFNGTVIKVFINGVEVGSQLYTGTIKPSLRELRIGRMADASQTREFNGQIDEVRIWGKALTETEIRDRMCKKLKGNETGLLAYYRFDEGSGTSVADLSSNNFNMSLSATAPAWRGSGAHIGDTSIALYTNTWTGAALSLSHPDSDSMTVNTITGSPAGVQLYMVDGNHPDSAAPVGIFNLLNKRYWGVFVSGGTSASYKLEYDYRGFPGVLSTAALRLLYRTGAAWSLSPSLPLNGKIALTANASRQYVLASTSPQVTFNLRTPTDSSQINLSGWGAQTITYAWDKVATKTQETYWWYFDAVTGSFSPPKAKLKADNGGADTTLTLSYWRMDSVLNISSLAVGQARYFKWTVQTANGIQAAEPFYARYTRGTLGLDQWEMIRDFELFPTVTSGQVIHYHYSGRDPIRGSVEIMDMNGKLLKTIPVSINGAERGTIEMGNLPAATYLIKVGNNEKAFIGKVVKE